MVLGYCTIDALFKVRQLEEEILAKNKYFDQLFVNLQKSFGRVLQSTVWWSLRKLGVHEGLVREVQAMGRNTVDKPRIGLQVWLSSLFRLV